MSSLFASSHLTSNIHLLCVLRSETSKFILSFQQIIMARIKAIESGKLEDEADADDIEGLQGEADEVCIYCNVPSLIVITHLLLLPLLAMLSPF